jgi:hypothetical protein
MSTLVGLWVMGTALVVAPLVPKRFDWIPLEPPKPMSKRTPHADPAKVAQARHRSEPVREKDLPANTVAARPGSPEWNRQVARGRDLAFDVVALESLPVLRANSVPLVFAKRRPRGQVWLFDLASDKMHSGTVPDDAVVRELFNVPGWPALDAARRRAETELGGSVRIFALYSQTLYYALRGLTEEVLRRESIPPESVSFATVRLRQTGGRSFAVSLVGHS